MSVDVKTPTKAQFEHASFPCGAGPKAESENIPAPGHYARDVNSNSDRAGGNREHGGQPYGKQNAQKQGKKRRSFSERGPGAVPFKRRFSGRHGRKEHIIKPVTKFLQGGNSTDPLNLGSLEDEDISKALNAETPVSSPLPVPSHRKHEVPVPVLIPPNINDPLNLNSGEDVEVVLLSPKSGKKKRKHKHKKRSTSTCETGISETKAQSEIADSQKKELMKPLHVDVSLQLENLLAAQGESEVKQTQTIGEKLQKVLDKIVSPVVPQVSPKNRSKRKRNSSGGEIVEGGSGTGRTFNREDSEKSNKSEKISPHRPKQRKHSGHANQPPQNQAPKFKHPDKMFVHGNYNRYYGYRNVSQDEDGRMKCMQSSWFKDKDVLDIGCNIGHVTLTLARDFQPKSIVGTDIDGKLIGIAKKNIRHYLSAESNDFSKFPVSLPLIYGPVSTPSIPSADEKPAFPNNVSFVQANYVLENDELVELQQPEYDTILALSLTKWIHLNNGDVGIKRFFKRIFKQLRPGGKLVLEPQAWASYKRKKTLTETINKHFLEIKLRPDRFTKYLLSPEVGFFSCEYVDVPHHKSKGFQRPIQVYTKPDLSRESPALSRGVTPLMEIDVTPSRSLPSYTATPVLDSRGATPRFELDSRGGTPKFCDSDSAGGTPRFEICTNYMPCDTPPVYWSRGATPQGTPGYDSALNIDYSKDSPESVERPLPLRTHSDAFLLTYRREQSLRSELLKCQTKTPTKTFPTKAMSSDVSCSPVSSVEGQLRVVGASNSPERSSSVTPERSQSRQSDTWSSPRHSAILSDIPEGTSDPPVFESVPPYGVVTEIPLESANAVISFQSGETSPLEVQHVDEDCVSPQATESKSPHQPSGSEPLEHDCKTESELPETVSAAVEGNIEDPQPLTTVSQTEPQGALTDHSVGLDFNPQNLNQDTDDQGQTAANSTSETNQVATSTSCKD